MKAIPADVPQSVHEAFTKNYNAITRNTDHVFLFTGDQKIEHLNADFHGTGITPEAAHPEHLFKIASQGNIGAFATHLGLIARYGTHTQFNKTNYIAKLNGKTNLIPTEQRDPISQQLWSVHDALMLKEQSGLSICGVGYTLYLGSEYEPVMLAQAAQMVYQAHHVGLVAILWIYPRGKHIHMHNPEELIIGAAGIANAVGADFVKIQVFPTIKKETLQAAVAAAGNTGVMCAGGEPQDTTTFLQHVEHYMHNGKCAGVAVGRNIFQHPLEEALRITNAIAEMVYNGKTFEAPRALL